MWESVLDALIDSVKALPILLIVYILIEFMEHRGEVKFEKIVASSQKYGPLWGAGLGIIPQCGFSAVMADLFSRKILTIGTLFAVFVATSDEAVTVLLSSPENIVQNLKSLGILIGLKLLLAIVVGYVMDLIFKNQKLQENKLEHSPHYKHEHTHKHDMQEIESDVKNAKKVACETCQTEIKTCDSCIHDNLHHHHELEEETKQNKSKVAWHIILQGLIHTAQIFAYILIANIVISLIIHFAGGEEALKNIVSASAWYLPIICALIGLIPNCAGSVVLVELYTSGIISFASCLGGLCASAGVGLLVLYKSNKNIKQNILITLGLFLFGAIVGLIFNLFLPVSF